jgi:hypothetical protein
MNHGLKNELSIMDTYHASTQGIDVHDVIRLTGTYLIEGLSLISGV